MPVPIDRLQGGTPSARRKLNQTVDKANRLLTITGDSFIRVHDTPMGLSIGLNLDYLLAYIPKVRGASESVPAGVLFAVKVKLKGGWPGGNGQNCAFVYDVYPASTVWPSQGDPPSETRLLENAPPETEVIPGVRYQWVPTDGAPWGWGVAFRDPSEEGSPLLLYHVADERPTSHDCECP